MQSSRQENQNLLKELNLTKTTLAESQKEVSDVKKFTREAHAAETISLLEKDVERARKAVRDAEAQEEAGRRAHARKTEECNQLKAEKDSQAREIESLKARLAASEKEMQEASEFLAAVLPDQPDGATLKDVVVALNELHTLSQQSMEKAFQALWPAEPTPRDMTELAKRLKGAKRRLQTWKVSACREGAREAWAMAKTHYRLLKTEELAKVGPKGLDGKEIKAAENYESVMPAARLSEQDCLLNTIIDGLD